MWAQVWDGHLESRKNPDRLKRSIHVDRIGVHSTFVYIYAGLRDLMIWINCLFSFNKSFLLRKVEDVTTISKSQSLTLVSIKDCTLRVPNETTTLFLLRLIIKAIFIHTIDSSNPPLDNTFSEFAHRYLPNCTVHAFVFPVWLCLCVHLATQTYKDVNDRLLKYQGMTLSRFFASPLHPSCSHAQLKNATGARWGEVLQRYLS